MLTSIKLNNSPFAGPLDQVVVFIGLEEEISLLPLAEDDKSFLKQAFGGDQDSFLWTNGQSQTLYVCTKSHSSEEYQIEHSRKSGAKAWEKIQEWKAPKACYFGQEAQLFLAFVEGLMLSSYRFDKYKSQKKHRPDTLELYHGQLEAKEIEELQVLLNASFKARDLVNEPVSFLHALQLGEEIKRLGEQHGFQTELLEKAQIASLKMTGLLAVNAGSKIPPLFAILKYRPQNISQPDPVVLVGKGVVYDTGGLSLKPTANSMDFMKSDMAGAAAIIGAFCTFSQLDLPMEVIGLIPITDNRPGYNAMTPGDILTFANGRTVEIMDTDAEGRLILADALIYAQKYNPQLVIDLATLTGSAVAAVGKETAVMMGTASKEIKEMLQSSGWASFERVFEFPLWEEYGEQIQSEIADITNLGGPTAGAITAGKFLEHFIDYDWIHIDIAGPSFNKKGQGYLPAGGTGYGVRLLYRFLKKLTEKNEH